MITKRLNQIRGFIETDNHLNATVALELLDEVERLLEQREQMQRWMRSQAELLAIAIRERDINHGL